MKKTEETYTGSEIAVIGMSGRFPGAKSVTEFWDNLVNGVESISFFTDDELREAGISEERLAHSRYVKAKGALEDVETFDAAFFDYTPQEAIMMDPQFRLLHECTWEALEDAGYSPQSYKGMIGLYAGAAFNSQWIMRALQQNQSGDSDTLEAAVLNLRDYFSTLVSYNLNLKGPSFTVQTGCSTSLVAIHLAVQALLSGECSMALAGGVSINLPKKSGYLYQEGMINSPDGHCRVFDADAAGTVFGDGAGIVALKTLEDALEDGDHIDAVIRGSAINNDGNRKVGYTAPSTKGQIAAVRSAIHVAEVEPDSISYIEAHGTGTTLGDPIEIQALKEAFQTDRRGFCRIGSVKSNVGHLNNAAGIAGFIKTVLAMKHRLLPPTLHYQRPNPKIDFENSPFVVNQELTPWHSEAYPLRAGVSSFGIGGTNAHIILEESPTAASSPEERDWKLLLLSAKTPTALTQTTDNLRHYLESHPDTRLADVAYTLQVGREHFPHKRMIVCRDTPHALDLLRSVDSEGERTGVSDTDRRPAVFMFSGQGSQYVRMGLDLYRSEPIFRQEVDRCLEMAGNVAGEDLKKVLYPKEPGEAVSDIQRTDIAQPVLFIFEYALANMLMQWGIRPKAMIGHSIGEFVAACLSGVLSLEDALSLVKLRGKLMQEMPAGSMLSVSLDEEELKPYLHEDLSLAAVNAPTLCVVSGPDPAIRELAQQLSEEGREYRLLHTSHAFHSSMMEPVLDRWEAAVAELKLNRPETPYISNVSGTWIRDEEAVDPRYWAKQLREPVRFMDGLHTLMDDVDPFFIEVGPGNTLSTFVRSTGEQAGTSAVVHLVRHPRENVPDHYHLMLKLGRLWLNGVSIDWNGFYGDEQRQRVSLPTYPFDRRRYWIEERSSSPYENRQVEWQKAAEQTATAVTEDAEPAVTANPVEKKLVEIWEELFGIRGIGLKDHFFEIGGHSLKATTLISQIHKELNVEITLSDIFNHPTIQSLAQHIEGLDEKSYLEIEPVEKRPYYPVSSGQRRTYIIHQQIGDVTTYNMPMVLLVTGRPDIKRFEEAFRRLIRRHESLRTSFDFIDGEPVQIVHDAFDFSIECMEADKEELDEIIRGFIRPFDLQKAPLIRVMFVQMAEEKYALLVDMHNIISDGTSMNVFIREFSELYKGADLPELRIQYKDYAEWQRRLFQSEIMQRQEAYWLDRFSGDPPSFPMPLDYKREDHQTFLGETVKFSIPRKQVETLEEIGKQHNLTMNVLMFNLYTLLLSRYTGREDLVIGSLVAGRRHADVENIIGMFTNFLPIRLQVDPDRTFPEFLDRTNQVLIEAYENQDYPYDKLVEKLRSKLPANRNPLFDTMLIYHNEYDPDTVLEVDGLDFDTYEFAKGISKLDFKLDVVKEVTGELKCVLQYNKSLFRSGTMERMARHFLQLVEEVVDDPERKLKDIPLLTAEEEEEMAAKREVDDPPQQRETLTLAVSSTFTADPLADHLIWWGRRFGWEIDVRFAPYNQVFQELLDPSSLLSTNRGANLLMVRFEDWLRDDSSEEQVQCRKLERNFKELVDILERKDPTVPYFVAVFPVSTHLSLSPSVKEHLDFMTRRWKEILKEKENVHVVDLTDLKDLYQITDIFHPGTDQAGHLPFTDSFYAAMGTTVARHIISLKPAPFKVIALDCDHTLWRGIVGEEGPLGVKVEQPFLELQRFLLQKQREGMLLVLCSKNNEADVWEVFEQNPQMVLKKEHLAGWRINWDPKSANMQELAEELNLGLDSFILLDDNPTECLEMIHRCPEVLSLQLPEDPVQIPMFLRHVWAFDRLRVTSEDRHRTERYLTDRRRQQAQRESLSLQEFLRGLDLKMSMYPIQPEQWPRIAQMTQRTNQFNLSSIRRDEREVKRWIESPETKGWAIEAADRFGEYGVVGTVFARQEADTLQMDTFLLSCRVLGKGVEDAVLAGLRHYGEKQAITELRARWIATDKNQPFRQFLERTRWEKTDEGQGYIDFRLSLQQIPEKIDFITCSYDTPLSATARETVSRGEREERNAPSTSGPAAGAPADSDIRRWDVWLQDHLLHRPYLLPLEKNTAEKLLALPVRGETAPMISEIDPPTNELEEVLVEIWKEILQLQQVGIHDNFFELGGNSLLAIKLEVELESRGLAVENLDVKRAQTIRQMALLLSEHLH
nr:type I polyketide synthase [Paludifilum halophilum]